MTLPSRAASMRGDSYQIALGWCEAVKMLHDPDIISVSMEANAYAPFDDVVVQRERGSVFMQAKSSNHGDPAITEDELQKSSPKGRSYLQRMYTKWAEIAAHDEHALVCLVTNRSFDQNSKLLHNARDTDLERICPDRLKSKAAGALKPWRTHLGITEAELREFLKAWEIRCVTAPRLKDIALGNMLAAGLRRDDDAFCRGKEIVRGWIENGCGPQTADQVREQVKEAGLLAGTRPVTVELPERTRPYVLAVHGIQHTRPLLEPDVAVDFVHLYDTTADVRDRRVLRDPRDWREQVLPGLRKAAHDLENHPTKEVHVTGDMRLPMWFATGHSMPDTAKWKLSMLQRGAYWSTERLRKVDPACSRRAVGSGKGLAVAVSLTHDLSNDVDAWAEERASDIGTRLTLLPEDGEPGPTAVPDGAWAVGWAWSAREQIRTAAREADSDRVHLFMAAPAGAALMLGHWWNMLPSTTVYEHLPNENTYVATFAVA